MKTETTVDKLIEHITSECSPVNQERLFDDMLDECYSFEKVGGPFENMSPARVLKEVDPTAYRCAMNDYFGTDDSYVEVAGELYEQREVEKARDEFVDGLDGEIGDLEKEIEELEQEDAENENDEAETNAAKILGLSARLGSMRANAKEATNYTF